MEFICGTLWIRTLLHVYAYMRVHTVLMHMKTEYKYTKKGTLSKLQSSLQSPLCP